MPTTLTMAKLAGAQDFPLGASDWVEITQEMIDQFADATLDHQWIHVDRERAAAGPFGTTIAHGFLTLSLLSHFASQLLVVPDASMGVNYGLDKVRMTAPAPSGSRVRGVGKILRTEPRGEALMVHVEITVEIEDAPKPALVATWLTLRYP